MKRLLFVLCSLVAVQEVCARRPAVRFDLPYTVEHGKYVVVLGTPAGPRRFIFDTGASGTCISESLRCESIYEYADKVSDFSMKQAYLAYAEIPDYRDVAEKKNEILKKWITRSVENGNVNDFFASVKLNRAEERLCLRAVLDLLADETSRSVKAMSPVICDFYHPFPMLTAHWMI